MAVIEKMEYHEFEYSLNNVVPETGNWTGILLESMEVKQHMISSMEFFDGIQIKPRVNGHIVLDVTIQELTRRLFVGLVTGQYPVERVRETLYIDPCGLTYLSVHGI